MTGQRLAMVAALLAATLVPAAPAGAQVDRCHIDVTDRDRHEAALDVRNTGTGRCRFVVAHRCADQIRVRRLIVLREPHRVAVEIDCGNLRLHRLRAEVIR
jgi:hypothetical protein